MAEHTLGAPEGPRPEVYSHGYGAAMVAHMAQRTADRDGAYFLPHLRPGMAVLDCGCGPGGITLGLAEAVAPGRLLVGVGRRGAPDGWAVVRRTRR